jgi:hypothetical protein
MSDEYNLNDANDQRSFDVIPANTICTLQLKIRAGGAGDGWLKTSKNNASEGLDCEFIVVDGPFAKRKLWKFLVLHGTTPGHAEAAEISRGLLRAVLESARGIRHDDTGETARAGREVKSWGDFDNLRFVARLGIEPPKDGFQARNSITEVLTPERQGWNKPEQIEQTSAGNESGGAGATAAQPANAIARPEWAKPE